MGACRDQEEILRLKRELREEMAFCRQRLLFKFPFTAFVMMRYELVPVCDDRLSTAATDGTRIFVDIAFFKGLSEQDRLFVLAHEAWHGLLLHPLRGRGYSHFRFNIAVDMEVNRLLAEEGFVVPDLALMPPREWKELSAEEMYEKIVLEEFRGRAVASTKPLGGQFDDHFRVGDDPLPKTKGNDPDYLPFVQSDLAEAIGRTVKGAAQQVERRCGRLPAHVQSLVGRLFKAELDWREILARFVTSAFGGSRCWLPPNRRWLARGVYLQSYRQEHLRAVVAVDTSGSVVHVLPVFFGELQGLLRSFGSYEVTVIQCDATIKAVETYDGTEEVDLSKIVARGGGGTDFRPVFRYLEEHPELGPSILVYLTDGYGPADERGPDCPVLWVLTGDGRKPADWGDVVHFKRNE